MFPTPKQGALPKYQSLQNTLEQMIRDELTIDEAIPSESELQERYGMSRMTVRRAVEQLVSDGRLYRVIGVGTFVARSAAAVDLHLSSFTDDMGELGIEVTQRVVTLDHVPLAPDQARRTGLVAGETMVRLNRIRFGAGHPICIEFSLLPATRFPGLVEAWKGGSLFELLEKKYDLRPSWSKQRISAQSASREVAHHLGVKPGTALLKVEQLAYSKNDLVEMCTSLYRPDSYELTATLSANSPALTPSIPSPEIESR